MRYVEFQHNEKPTLGQRVKGVAKALQTTTYGALDALSGRPDPGIGNKIYAQLTGKDTFAPPGQNVPGIEKYKPGQIIKHPRFGEVRIISVGSRAIKLDTKKRVGHNVIVPIELL